MTAGIGDNSGIFEPQEVARDAIEEALRPLWTRFRTLAESFGRVPETLDEDTAKKATDLDGMFGSLQTRIDQEHERVKLPYLEAGRTVDGLANALRDEIAPLRHQLSVKNTAFLEAKQAAIDAAREAERAAEAADPEPGWTPPKRKAAVRGDFGARASLRDTVAVEVFDVKKVPKSVLEHPDVLKAIAKVAKPILLAKQKCGGCKLITGKKAVTTK